MNLDRVKELREYFDYLKITHPCDVRLAIIDIPNKAKQLKEKVEKGCDKFFNQDTQGDNKTEVYYNLTSDYCGMARVYQQNKFISEYRSEFTCPDCQETLKILNKILGEKE